MKFQAICNVEYPDHSSVEMGFSKEKYQYATIKAGTKVTVELARNDIVHIKVGNDTILKPIPAAVFNVCFKRLLFFGYF